MRYQINSYLGINISFEKVRENEFLLGAVGPDDRRPIIRRQWSNFQICKKPNIGSIAKVDGFWEATYSYDGPIILTALHDNWKSAATYVIDFYRADAAYNHLKKMHALSDDYLYNEDSLTINRVTRSYTMYGERFSNPPVVGFNKVAPYRYLVDALTHYKDDKNE